MFGGTFILPSLPRLSMPGEDKETGCQRCCFPGANEPPKGAFHEEGPDWRVGLCQSPCIRPATYCSAVCCPCYVAHRQRGKILDLAHEPYVCFGGRYADWRCCCCGCSKYCPFLEDPYETREPYLCLEVCFCMPLAVAANRFLIQDHFGRPVDVWSDCICCCLVALQLTQHADELDEIASEIAERHDSGPPMQALMLDKHRLQADFDDCYGAADRQEAAPDVGSARPSPKLAGPEASPLAAAIEAVAAAAGLGSKASDAQEDGEKPPSMAFAGFPWFQGTVFGRSRYKA